MAYGIGIDLGGSSVKALAVDRTGKQLSARVIDFADDAQKAWASAIRRVILAIEQEQQSAPAAMGLSAPGLAADDELSIAYMPGRLQGLEGLNWTTYLDMPRIVPVLNDGHAALVGESWAGAARGFKNAIMLTLGTGVGGAAMVDGRLLRGGMGRAGHLGHISIDPHGLTDVCRTPGSLESAMGNCTIRERTGGRYETTHALVAAAMAGDGEALQIWLKSVDDLARAVASFINLFDPEAVIVGGGVARAGAFLFGPLEEKVRRYEWQPGGRTVPILAAELGEFAGAFGAAKRGFEVAEPSSRGSAQLTNHLE